MGLDKAALVAWLTERAASRTPIVGAIYTGLAERINRGDFDEEEGA
jgi:hypothetical protein